MKKTGSHIIRMMAALCLTVSLLALLGCPKKPPAEGNFDEAHLAGRAAETFPGAEEDYFHDMDSGVKLTSNGVVGRNNWVVWTAGNDHFWDTISQKSVGTLDLLKTISSYPNYPAPIPKFGRHNRWEHLGLVNEPCFEEATGPDPARFGLWLDKRKGDCPPDPFENEKKYPGLVYKARGKNLPAGSYYGYATGIVGLRLFPNPDFDEAAAKNWDPARFYSDPSYYLSKTLVKPFRVGMSCGFCHVGPNPVHPPKDPENPTWADLSSNVGAQYFWIDRIFTWDTDKSSFPYQLFHTSRPGALDTSLVSTDSINNPRTMNAVYSLNARLDLAKRFGVKETLAGGSLDNKQFNDYFKSGPLTELFQPPATVFVPHILKDGSDSVGALGALNRVYLNIGLFSEDWLTHFNPLVGGKPITPIQIKVARANSPFWQANESQTPALAEFFLASTAPHLLKDAPGGAAFLATDAAKLTRGKTVFAERCARCHSSKLPPLPAGTDPFGCAGPNYLNCWNKYWAWTKTEDFKKPMRELALKDDFTKDNFLSTELRVPVTLLETNACSPLATNAIAGNIWDNFSSQSYKDLPSVGTITVRNPFNGEPWQYTMPAGGRGYTRPASLISLWSTAPFLLNNTVGNFSSDPSVAGRMGSFNDSIEKMLWPEKREKDVLLGNSQGVFLIDRTSEPSYLRVPKGYLPDFLQKLPLDHLTPTLAGEGGLQIGPIPTGTPINLLSNVNLLPDHQTTQEKIEHDKKLFELLIKVKHDLLALPPNATSEQARQVFANLAKPLLELSKCPDFEVNRGHYFGTDRFKEEPGLSDDDKHALIEFLKTF